MAQQYQACPNCHSPLPKGATFCGNCGSTVYGGYSGTFSVTPPPPPVTSYGGPYGYDPYNMPTELPSASTVEPTVYAKAESDSPKPNNDLMTPFKPKKSRWPLLATLGIVVLIIIGSIIGVTVNSNYQATLHANATATAQSTAHGQATAQAVHETETAIAQATASAVAATKNPYASMNNLVIEDSLTQQNSRWAPFSGSDRSCAFLNGGLTLSVSAAPPLFCDDQQAAANFTDVTVAVNMNIASGDCGGLRIRDQATVTQPKAAAHYNFFVCSDGSYFLYKGSDILKQGTAAIASNTTFPVAIVAQGNAFKLFIAGLQVATASDNSYQSGDVGLIAGKVSSNTTVVYTHIRVWTP